MFDLIKKLLPQLGSSLFGSLQSGASSGLFDGLMRLFRGNDWYNSQIGKQLSGAQREANAFTQGLQIQNQNFNAAEAEKQRQFQIDYYNQIQSPQAQVEAYQRAGLNPALLYGGISAPSAAGGSAASSGAGQSVGAGAGVNLVTIADLALQKERVDIDKVLARSEAAYKDSQTALNNIDIQYRGLEKEYGLAESQARISQAFSTIQNQLSEISLRNSEIEVNGHRIELLDAQTRGVNAETELTGIKTALARLDVEKARLLLPYAEEVQRAEIALKYAQSSAARAAAENSLYQGNLAFINAMREADLIDEGYYDLQVKTARREYKWMPVNNTVNAVSKVVTAAAGVALGASGFGRAAGAAGSIGSRLWMPTSGSVQTDSGRVTYGFK